jgi:uncharacterized membrane protein
VSTQYSYLPSWITIAVDPRRSIESADALFNVVYSHWKSLPKAARPKLYLQGLSLGSLGSEASSDLLTMFEDPIQGAVWSGPPFPSRQWNNLTAHRNPNSPAWLPEFRDGRIARFTSQQNTLMTEKEWGPIRNVYVQYASDPMVFFSPSLLYQKPAWLSNPRGPDVSPHLTWYPIVTFLQIAFRSYSREATTAISRGRKSLAPMATLIWPCLVATPGNLRVSVPIREKFLWKSTSY